MAKSKIVHFVRHCKPQKHERGYTLDFLTPEGITHAELVAKRFAKKTIIISSPYNRTLETACKLKEKLDSRIIENSNWGEISMGIYTSKPYSDFLENWGKENNSFDYIPPKGESVNNGRKRILQGVKELLSLKNDEIICVTHASIIANLRMMVEGISFESAKPKYGEGFTLCINKEDLSIFNLSCKSGVKIKDLDNYLNNQRHEEI